MDHLAKLALPNQDNPLHPTNLFALPLAPRHQTSPDASNPFSEPSPRPPSPFHEHKPPKRPEKTPPKPLPPKPPKRPISFPDDDLTLSPPYPSSPSLSNSWLSTYDPYELPISTTISASRPLKARTNGMHITFEMGCPEREGVVRVTDKPRIDGRMIRNTIDVGKMGEGESKVLKRRDREGDVVVNLRNGRRGKMTQVVMAWA